MSSMYPPPGGPSSRRCLRCGMPLSLNVVNCGQCGAYNPIPQPNGPVQSAGSFTSPWSGGQAGQAATGSGQYPGSWGPPPAPPMQPAPPQNMPPGNTFMPQSSQFQAPAQQIPFPGQNFGQSGQYSQPTFNSYGNVPQQNFNMRSPSATLNGTQYGNMSGNGTALDGYEPPSEERRGHGVGFIIGIVLLLIVLIGGGFLAFTFVQNRTQNNNTAGTTSKTPVISTPTVKPLFNDSFTNNNAGWDLTSAPGKFSVVIGNGAMTLEDDENKLLPELIPSKSFSNFQLEVDATLTKGDKSSGYGVYIRGGSSQDSYLGIYYRFELYGDGTYAIFKGTLDSSGNTLSTKVQGYLANPAIAQEGHANHITIIANGSDMTFKVNGQVVSTYHDSSYKGGSVALFVSNLPQTPPVAQATFANLSIFPLA